MNPSSRPVRLATDDDLTPRSCTTGLFRWVRAGADFVEHLPSHAIDLAADVQQAWHDSAKR